MLYFLSPDSSPFLSNSLFQIRSNPALNPAPAGHFARKGRKFYLTMTKFVPLSDPVESSRGCEDEVKTDEVTSSTDPPCCPRLSRRQVIALAVQCLTSLTISTAMSFYPPFYPRLAEQKGYTSEVYGAVLGSNCLTAFFVTPIIGKYLHVIGHRFAFIAGIFVNGGCSILAGFLCQVPSGISFLSLTVAIRVVNAIGNAGIITSSLSFIAFDFPMSVSSIFAVTRLMSNIGQALGPALGGALYEVGGFELPFIVLGCSQCVVGIVSFFFLPTMKNKTSEEKVVKPITYRKIFQIPAMWVPFSIFVVTTLANGFLSVTLEPQVLRQFSLNYFYLGLISGIKDGASSLSSPIWGWLCERRSFVKPCIVICCITICIVYFILGPFPGIGIPPILWLICLLLSLNGVGINGLQVSGVIDILHEIIDAGYPDDPLTYSCVAGLWSSFSGLGRFLSRTTSGILVHHIGFQLSSAVICGFMIAEVVLMILIMSLRKLEPSSPTVWYQLEEENERKTEKNSESLGNRLLVSYDFQRSRSFVETL